MVTLAALGGAAYAIGWGHEAEPVRQTAAPFDSGVQVPSDLQMQRIAALLPRLSALARPQARKVGDISMALFGDQSRPAAPNADGGRDGAGSASQGYRLTLTVTDGPQRFCIVDGQLVDRGGKLKGGGVVQEIENQRVLIGDGERAQWVWLTEPPSQPKAGQADRKGKS
jgi:hypothetical protein